MAVIEFSGCNPSRYTRPDLFETAEFCGFCGSGDLFFELGSVACDVCQARGPFCGLQFGSAPEGDERDALYLKAINLWNARHIDAWQEAIE